jgi:hypothetical protein
MAKRGIGGEDFWRPGDYRSHIPDGRTAVAVDLASIGRRTTANMYQAKHCWVFARDISHLEEVVERSLGIQTRRSPMRGIGCKKSRPSGRGLNSDCRNTRFMQPIAGGMGQLSLRRSRHAGRRNEKDEARKAGIIGTSR